MTHLHLAARTGPTLPSRLSAALTSIADYLGMLAAATRAARAVEARRDPRPADLETLGITGKLPKAW